jgi:hypothetical protein
VLSRKYKNRAERDRAYKLRKQEREKPRISTPEREETRISTPDPMKDMAVAIAETIVAALPSALHVLLVDAARWNVDRDADVAPIRALLDQGCDLEADVLPTVPPRFPARATARPVLQRPR